MKLAKVLDKLFSEKLDAFIEKQIKRESIWLHK